MRRALLIGDQSHRSADLLRTRSYDVATVPSGAAALDAIHATAWDVVVSDMALPDMSVSEMVRAIRRTKNTTPVIAVASAASTRAAVDAMRAGTTDIVDVKDLSRELPRLVDRLCGTDAHATGRRTVRWAHAVVGIIDCPSDPRTIEGWSRWSTVPVRELRSACAAAGCGPRRSLLFGRLLRAVALSDGGRHKPQDLLDVVDRRTLNALLRLAGLSPTKLCHDVREFLSTQVLIRHPAALAEIKKALAERSGASRELERHDHETSTERPGAECSPIARSFDASHKSWRAS